MLIAIIILTAVLVFSYVLLMAKNNKFIFAVLVAIGLISTIYLCISKPVLHKPFSISVIDYLIKFNTDGSMTTTKQTTTTVIKEDNK